MAERSGSAPVPPWHALGAAVVSERLRTDPARGLGEDQARRRLIETGPNELREIRRTRWPALLARQFTSVFILILFGAAALSALLGEVVDALAIGAILLLNGLLGFVQEWRAERAVAALRRMVDPECFVIRDGARRRVEVATLVPGDLVPLEVGDRVPADIRLSETADLRADESALTGESLSVHKRASPVDGAAPPAERASMAWKGTTITQGCALGLVVSTGMRTEFGRIAELTQGLTPTTTPLGRKLGALARQLGVASLAIAFLVMAVGLATGRAALEMFLTAVSLAVAVVPEGLPAVVTITLALGIRRLAQRRALVRRLAAAETLGAATVVCTDKTGTLTENEMTVRRVWLASGAVEVTGSGYDPEGRFERHDDEVRVGDRPDLRAALVTGLWCNRARVEEEEGAWRATGEPTEAALIVAATKAGLARTGEPAAEIAFTAERRRMTVLERTDAGVRAHVKGAPEVILARCAKVLDGERTRALGEEERRRAVAAYEALAGEGLRTLALARRDLPPDTPTDADAIERELVLLGIAGILDPPRPEVPGAVAQAHAAGISVIMITGDAPPTALAIARRVGLETDRAITGTEVDALGDDELAGALEGDSVFARAMPEQKLRIVDLLQRAGHIVAMTGDGVNDAPALKKADIGIAMGMRGTAVAKEASDIIVTDDNFASIVGAVEEGRRQFDNIRKFVSYLLSSNAGEITAILSNLLIGGPLILLPVQILWMNLVTDSVTALALGAEPAEADLMRRPPRDPEDRIVDRRGLLALVALGLYIGLATLWLYQHYRARPGGALVAQTVAFTGIIVLEKVNVFNFRSLHAPVTVRGFFANRWLLLAWVAMIGLQVAAVYVPLLQTALHTVPLAARDWLHIAAVALPLLVVPEIVKRVLARRRGHP